MPQVTVTIAGRPYRMACGEGEEAHLEGLAAAYDEKIQDLRGALGELGDMRLHVMAALTLADDLAEQNEKLEAVEAEMAALKVRLDIYDEAARAREEALAGALGKASERIERLARGLGSGPATEE